jgi:hypothetical protein
MAKFSKVEEAESESKRYGCVIPAYSYDSLETLDASSPEAFLKDVLEVTGGNLESAASLIVKSFNSEARKAASGVDEFFKMAVNYKQLVPKYKNANPFKLAAILRKGEFATGS